MPSSNNFISNAGRHFWRVTKQNTKTLFGLASKRPWIAFWLGFTAGAGLELVKIYWKPGGINYYSVRQRKALDKNAKEYREMMQLRLDSDLAELNAKTS